MPNNDEWLDIRQAVALCRRIAGGSIDAAKEKICEACASGSVEWRTLTDAGPRPLTRGSWADAATDLETGELILNGWRRRRDVHISAGDLRHWLGQQSQAPRPEKMAPAAGSGTRRAAAAWKEDADKAYKERTAGGRYPTAAEDEAWRKKQGIPRSRIRDLRANNRSAEAKKGGAPKGRRDV
jgi:hypothetical protein